MQTNVGTHIRTHAYTHAGMPICTHAWPHACTYMFICTYMIVHKNIYIYHFIIVSSFFLYQKTHKELLQQTKSKCCIEVEDELSDGEMAQRYHLIFQ